MSEDEYLKGIMAKTAARKAALAEPTPMTPPTKAMLELADRIENARGMALMEQPKNPGPVWAMPLGSEDQTAIITALRSSQNGGMDQGNSSGSASPSGHLSAVDSSLKRPPTPRWDRRWPHDQPDGWNLDAAKFLALIQSANGFMWLGLTKAKYIELRVDTRDGAFNLYDRDGQPLNPDDVVAAVESAIARFGSASSVSDNRTGEASAEEAVVPKLQNGERVNSHEALVKALQFIVDGADNQDVNHRDYRIKVCQVASEALALISQEQS